MRVKSYQRRPGGAQGIIVGGAPAYPVKDLGIRRRYRRQFANGYGVNCSVCGWPVANGLYDGKDEEGERLVKHVRCPSLSERRRMRQEALENA